MTKKASEPRIVLDKAMKNFITSRVLDDLYSEKKNNILNTFNTIGDTIYEKTYGQYQSAMKSMPRGFFAESKSITICSNIGILFRLSLEGGKVVDFYRSAYKRTSVSVPLSTTQLFPHNEEEFHLSEKLHDDVMTEANTLLEDIEKSTNELQIILSNYRSANKFVEAHPVMKKYVKAYLDYVLKGQMSKESVFSKLEK